MVLVPREPLRPTQRWPMFCLDDSPVAEEHGVDLAAVHIVACDDRGCRVRTNDCVLEVGAVSGYAAALLGLLARRGHRASVTSTLNPPGAQRFRFAGYRNIDVSPGRRHAAAAGRAVRCILVGRLPGPGQPPAIEWRHWRSGGRLGAGRRMPIAIAGQGQRAAATGQPTSSSSAGAVAVVSADAAAWPGPDGVDTEFGLGLTPSLHRGPAQNFRRRALSARRLRPEQTRVGSQPPNAGDRRTLRQGDST